MKKAAVLCWLLLVAGCAPQKGIPSQETSDEVRIVSFLPSGTETLFALGLGPYVIGRSSFCDYPPEVAGLPVVGDLFSAKEDTLVALRPTHAILGRTNAPQAPLLHAINCKIIEERAETAADILAFADTLGRYFPARTNGLACEGSTWRKAMEELALAKSPQNAERVLVVVSHAPGRFGTAFVAGEATFHDELLRAAGFANALAGTRGYPVLDPDKIAEIAPDLLIDIHPDGEEAHEVSWNYLPNTRIVILCDTAALRPGPRLPDILLRFRGFSRHP